MAKTDDCKHNPMIICANHSSCAQCGWNPSEAKRRREYLRKHKTQVGMIKRPRDADVIISKNKPKKLLATDIRTGEKVVYESLYATKRGGFTASSVLMVLRGERSQHKGWKFERMEGET